METQPRGWNLFFSFFPDRASKQLRPDVKSEKIWIWWCYILEHSNNVALGPENFTIHIKLAQVSGIYDIIFMKPHDYPFKKKTKNKKTQKPTGEIELK